MMATESALLGIDETDGETSHANHVLSNMADVRPAAVFFPAPAEEVMMGRNAPMVAVKGKPALVKNASPSSARFMDQRGLSLLDDNAWLLLCNSLSFCYRLRSGRGS